MTIKRYIQAPLPFQGQKRNWVKILEALALQLPKGATVVDVFGGSGLCAHIFKTARPDLRVIWNDYDNYQERLSQIPQTNIYVQKLYEVMVGIPKDSAITPPTEQHSQVYTLLQQAKDKGLDMQTLMGFVTFSQDRSYRLSPNMTFYRKYQPGPPLQYDATGYLDGVERIRLSYDELLPTLPLDAILILDPPYLNTDTRSYAKNGFCTLIDHLNLMSSIKGHQYIYFTSSKSNIQEMDAWIGKVFGKSLLGNYRLLSRYQRLEKARGYTDYILTNIGLDNAQQ